MIKVYTGGKEFVGENSAFLDENKYMSSFFYIDARVLTEPSEKNYALKAFDGGKTLLAIKVEPYNLLLYGDKECADELLLYLKDNGFIFDGIMCPTETGEYVMSISEKLIERKYVLTIGMDFMEATEYTEATAKEVIPAVDSDVDEIFDNSVRFFIDCNLPDKPDKAKLTGKLPNFRVIKENGKIVSMAMFSEDTDTSARISYVFTKAEYRGKGYARKVVNAVKNEILSMGKVATLNVDRANPISNHLYSSLGFRKVFSQGIYLSKQ